MHESYSLILLNSHYSAQYWCICCNILKEWSVNCRSRKISLNVSVCLDWYPFFFWWIRFQATAEEWRHVFYVCAAVSVVGAMVYAIFAEGELHSWAAPPSVLQVEYHSMKEIENRENLAHLISQYEDASPGNVTKNNADLLIPRKESSSSCEPQKEDSS